ncbi:Uncharacterised protein [Yersinia kristensenii]|nr:Uncharacterised protein [Yersinia kristensenii]
MQNVQRSWTLINFYLVLLYSNKQLVFFLSPDQQGAILQDVRNFCSWH